jgi:hypothetical protein
LFFDTNDDLVRASRNWFPVWLSFLLPTVLFMFFSAQQTGAADFSVNSIHDVNDLTPGDGLCVAYVSILPPYVFPFCTLRAAIEEANSLPGTDRIILPTGTFVLTIPGYGEDSGAKGDLDITDSLIIAGAGKDRTFLDGGGLDRIFDIVEPDITVTLSGMTIINGFMASTAEEGGGAIRNNGSLYLTGVTVAENSVRGTAGTGHGGGILNFFFCTISTSTVNRNSAEWGGGIYNGKNASLNVNASTIWANYAAGGSGVYNEGSGRVRNSTVSGNRTASEYPARGGGVWNSGNMAIIQSTIAGNIAPHGGGLHNEGYLRMTNTLLADNGALNCSVPARIDSFGFNLDSDDTCGLRGENDLTAVDARLNPLSFTGGPTSTHSLGLGSAAVDAGKNLFAEGVTTDQRGVARPQGEGFDIGSWEMEKFSIVPAIAPLLLR